MSQPPLSIQSRLTPLARSTTQKGPNAVGGSRPRSSAVHAAAALPSSAWAMVWLSWTGMSSVCRRDGLDRGRDGIDVGDVGIDADARPPRHLQLPIDEHERWREVALVVAGRR